MTTPTDSAHAEAIEKAKAALNECIRSAIEDGVEVSAWTGDITVGGQVHEDAYVELLVYRRIECATD